MERALHDLGWPGREAHEKTVGLLSPRIDGNVEREYGLEKQRALTYFDPKKQRDLTRDLQRREEEEEEQPAAEEGIRRRRVLGERLRNIMTA